MKSIVSGTIVSSLKPIRLGVYFVISTLSLNSVYHTAVGTMCVIKLTRQKFKGILGKLRTSSQGTRGRSAYDVESFLCEGSKSILIYAVAYATQSGKVRHTSVTRRTIKPDTITFLILYSLY